MHLRTFQIQMQIGWCTGTLIKCRILLQMRLLRNRLIVWRHLKWHSIVHKESEYRFPSTKFSIIEPKCDENRNHWTRKKAVGRVCIYISSLQVKDLNAMGFEFGESMGYNGIQYTLYTRYGTLLNECHCRRCYTNARKHGLWIHFIGRK